MEERMQAGQEEEAASSADLAALERRLAKLEGDRKDGWDKFQILTSMLLPIALALAGYSFSRAIADAQRSSEDRRALSSQAVAEASMHVSQAELVATFMKSLLSQDRAEKELAVRAVLLALPEAGPQLVAAVEVGSTDAQTRQVAKKALDERRDKLVNDIYAANGDVQKKATEQLMLGFREDPALIETLAREAQDHRNNHSGLYNSAVVMQAVPSQQLQAKPNEVHRFSEIAKQGGSQTQALVQQIEQRSSK
jgi:hypothetical protein